MHLQCLLSRDLSFYRQADVVVSSSGKYVHDEWRSMLCMTCRDWHPPLASDTGLMHSKSAVVLKPTDSSLLRSSGGSGSEATTCRGPAGVAAIC